MNYEDVYYYTMNEWISEWMNDHGTNIYKKEVTQEYAYKRDSNI